MIEALNPKEIYDDYLKKVEERIDECSAIKNPVSLYEPIKYLMSGGGKRIRPILAMLCAGAVGGNPEDALDSAVAIEILHNFTLVHDDIMDKSPMRRNRPTVHTKWDESTAILAGDVMVGLAYNLLPTPKQHERSQEIHAAFTKGLIEVCEGQAYDMEFNFRADVTLDEYFTMIEKKTAKLLETSAIIGAHIGKGSPKEISSLKNYANSLGIAFQIQDDLLDLTAEQIKLGKTIGQDIVEGKKTYLIIKAAEKAKTSRDRELLDKFMTENGLPQEHIIDMQNMFKRLGVFKDAQNEAEKRLLEAKKSLQRLKNNQSTEMLGYLLGRLNKRKY